jgi:hypothetical protein
MERRLPAGRSAQVSRIAGGSRRSRQHAHFRANDLIANSIKIFNWPFPNPNFPFSETIFMTGYVQQSVIQTAMLNMYIIDYRYCRNVENQHHFEKFY